MAPKLLSLGIMSQTIYENDPCPCCSGESFASCCGPVIATQSAPTPLALMRSRYTAYVLDDLAYIERTMKGPALKAFLKTKETETTRDGHRWLKLEIVDVPAVKSKDKQGIVEFVAYFEVDGVPQKLHERSKFLKISGCWFYFDGKMK